MRSPSPPTGQRPPCLLVTSPAHVPPGGRRSEPGLGCEGVLLLTLGVAWSLSGRSWGRTSQPGPARRRPLKEEAVEGEAGGADQGQGQEDRWGGSSRGRRGEHPGSCALQRDRQTARLVLKAGVKSCLGLRPFCFYKSLLLEVLIRPLSPLSPPPARPLPGRQHPIVCVRG